MISYQSVAIGYDTNTDKPNGFEKTIFEYGSYHLCYVRTVQTIQTIKDLQLKPVDMKIVIQLEKVETDKEGNATVTDIVFQEEI